MVEEKWAHVVRTPPDRKVVGAGPVGSRHGSYQCVWCGGGALVATLDCEPYFDTSRHLLLYLSARTWLGAEGDELAEEVRAARASGLPIVMVHATDEEHDGCGHADGAQHGTHTDNKPTS